MRDMKVARLNLFEEGRYEFVIEREAPDKEYIEDDATAPNVNLWSGIQFSGYHFRCRIVWAATAGLQKVAVCHDVAQAEVGNFDVVVFVQQQILWLEISMDDLVSMTVLDSTYYLLEHLSGFLFVQPAMLDDIVEKFHWGIFKHHDDIVLIHDDRIELDDVWVSQ